MPFAKRHTMQELERLLAPYQCVKVGDVAPGVELWETGWKEAFTLMPDSGAYDYFQYRRALLLITKAMPQGWQAYVASQGTSERGEAALPPE